MKPLRALYFVVCAGLVVLPAFGAGPANTGEPVDPSTFGQHVLTQDRTLPDGLRLLYAPSNDDDVVFRAQLSRLLGVSVDYYDTRAGTPSVGLLTNYDCVFTWTNSAHTDATAFGDNLADAVDAGTTVILGPFSTYTQGSALSGRIMTSGYSPVYSPSGGNHFTPSTWAGDGVIATHEAVEAYEATFRDELSLLGSGAQDASYVDGEIAVAAQLDFKTSYMNGGTDPNSTEPGDWPILLTNLCRSGAFDVLVLDSDSVNHYAVAAAAQLAVNYSVTDSTNFNAMLGSREWDLVLADVPSNSPTGGWTDFLSYLGGGGPAVLSYWGWSFDSNLAAPFGYTSAVDMSWAPGVSSLGPAAGPAGTHAFAGVPEVPHSNWSGQWLSDGAVFTPVAGTTTVGLLDGADPVMLLNPSGNGVAAPLIDEWSGTGADELWRNLALEVLPHDQFDGVAVLADWLYPDDATVLETHPLVVGPGVDLPDAEIQYGTGCDIFIHGPYIEFEFSSAITYDTTTFNGWRFADLDSRLPGIGGASLDFVSAGVIGLGPDDLTYTEDSVSLNLSGVETPASGYIRIRVDFGLFFDGFETGTTDAWSGVSP